MSPENVSTSSTRTGKPHLQNRGIDVLTLRRYAKAPHKAYVGDSIFGNHTNLGAGSCLANFKERTGREQVIIRVGSSTFYTGLRKLGCDSRRPCSKSTNPALRPVEAHRRASVKKSPGNYPGDERGIVCAIDERVKHRSQASAAICSQGKAADVWQHGDQHRQCVERDDRLVML